MTYPFLDLVFKNVVLFYKKLSFSHHLLNFFQLLGSHLEVTTHPVFRGQSPQHLNWTAQCNLLVTHSLCILYIWVCSHFSKYCCSNHNKRNKESSKVHGCNSKSKTYQNLENSQIMSICYGEDNTCEIKQISPGDSGVPYHL